MTRTYTLSPMTITNGNRLRRAVWTFVWTLLYRPSPRPLHGWRRWLLRCFGARIESEAHPYPRVRIWAPWNLTMGAHSCLADDVDCYNVADVVLGRHSIVSQYTYLCTATHDHRDPALPLMIAPIHVGAQAWVAARSLVGPGVAIGRGAVVGAGSTVMRDVADWTVVAGSPALPRGTRPPQRERD